MRALGGFCLLTLVGCAFAAVSHGDYASEVMADAPVAYYRFEESAGATSIADSSGNGHGSPEVSNVLFEATGLAGKAGRFSNGYARLDLQLSPTNGDFSIEALVRFDSTDINRHVASQQNGSGTGRVLLHRTGGGYPGSYLGGTQFLASAEVDEGAWAHLVMTVDVNGGADTVRFYIDGQPAGGSNVTVEAADGDWILGAHKSLSGGLVGLLDEVAIYTNRLSDSRVAAHYEELAPTPVHYVSTNGTSVWPYTNRVSAATNIQDAIDAAAAGNTVLVSNGTYTSASQIIVHKEITVRSVNGAGVTIVDGENAHRCFDLGNTACTISGFTVTRGKAWGNGNGGGIRCAGASPVITHCTFAGNWATGWGGGSYRGTLENCTFTGNRAQEGGGSSGGTLNHCTLTGNRATNGGGSRGGTLKNCISYYNTASFSGSNYFGGSFSYSCSPGLSGDGNITNAPLFVDAASSNFHLLASSPCIDAATSLASIVDDLDGVPRPLDGDADGVAVADMGACEFVSAVADTDGDGRVDMHEVAIGFNPTYNENYAVDHVTNNPAAYNLYTSNSILDLSMGAMMLQTSNGWLRLSLQLERADDLTGGVWSNAGDAVEWIEPAGEGKAFYRVRGGGE